MLDVRLRHLDSLGQLMIALAIAALAVAEAPNRRGQEK